MRENNLAQSIKEYQTSETLRFLRDLEKFHRLYGKRINLDKSLYFINYPKEDFA